MKKAFFFLWRFGDKVVKDDIFGLGAQIAYYFLLALFPMIIFFVTLIPFLPIEEEQFMSLIENIAPTDAVNMIQTIVSEVVARPSIGLLSFGVVAALWSASSGVNSIVVALNSAYHVEKKRFYLVQRIYSMGLTIGLLGALVMTLVLPVFGNQLGHWIFHLLGYEGDFPMVWKLLRWALSLIILILVFTVLYWFGPNLHIRIRDAIPGAIFTSIGWILSSLLFAFYVDNFGNYAAAYGSIGGIIILILWFYITGIFIIIGGELNAFLVEERQVREENRLESSVEPKL